MEDSPSHSTSTGYRRSNTSKHRWTLAIIPAAIVLCGLSFWGGVSYQKNHAPSLRTASGMGGVGGGFGNGARRGDIGQVTAISSTSITVQSQRTNSSKTYSISSSTSITDNGQTVQTSDIKSGDTVLVAASSSNSGAASSIMVNPSFGGPPSDTQSSDSTTQTN